MLDNLKETEYFFETNMFFDLLNKETNVMIDKEPNPDFEFAEKCMNALNNIPDYVIDLLCHYTVKYSEDFCDAIGEEPPVIECDRDILKYVYPGSLIVSAEEKGENDIVLHLELNCDWEPEHGLEWLVVDNKVLYVGAFNDVSSEYYDKGESWNYVTEE